MSERVTDGVSMAISPRDEMYALDANWDSYIGVATSALSCIRRSMDLARKRDVDSILDFACGHGRVLRLLKATFPEAQLTACDLNEDGVRFCAAEFGAAPVASHEDPAMVPLTGSFDLVWCGSLFSHLDAPRWDGFLTLIETVLETDGLFVFTVQGAKSRRPGRAARPIRSCLPTGSLRSSPGTKRQGLVMPTGRGNTTGETRW